MTAGDREQKSGGIWFRLRLPGAAGEGHRLVLHEDFLMEGRRGGHTGGGKEVGTWFDHTQRPSKELQLAWF